MRETLKNTEQTSGAYEVDGNVQGPAQTQTHKQTHTREHIRSKLCGLTSI